MLNIVADENVDKQIVERLRREGFKVFYIAEMKRGISDEEVFSLTMQEKALLITADKDFGEIVFRQSRTDCGVALLRLAGLPPDLKAAHVFDALQEHAAAMQKAFSVISHGAVRIRLKT